MASAAKRQPVTAEFRDRWVLYLTAAERTMLIKCVTLYSRSVADVKFDSSIDRSSVTPDELLERLIQAPRLEKGVRPPHE